MVSDALILTWVTTKQPAVIYRCTLTCVIGGRTALSGRWLGCFGSSRFAIVCICFSGDDTPASLAIPGDDVTFSVMTSQHGGWRGVVRGWTGVKALPTRRVDSRPAAGPSCSGVATASFLTTRRSCGRSEELSL